jgi:alpha-tubulin suppressor-like RCC1 family protein
MKSAVKILLKTFLFLLFSQTLSVHAAATVTAVASGSWHTLFLKSDGSLWAMGHNAYGQLGDGSFNNTNRPEQIVPNGVTTIAAGDYFSLFLKSDGSLWAMGINTYGQLGDGSNNSTNRPEQIIPGGVSAIACGSGHALLLKTDGSLWAMGYNTAGQLGDGTYVSTNRPEQILPTGVTKIAGGGYFSLFTNKIRRQPVGIGHERFRPVGKRPEHLQDELAAADCCQWRDGDCPEPHTP